MAATSIIDQFTMISRFEEDAKASRERTLLAAD
jgi:hypothetical protein